MIFKRMYCSGLAAAVIVGLVIGSGAPAWGQCDPDELAKLVASDAATADQFGVSVAVSGDTAVIGAHYDDVVGIDTGSAYVFVRNGSTWSEQAKLTASDGAAGDGFGYSVAISGDTIAVGAYADDDGGTNSGSAYVFTRSGTTWTQQTKLTASDATAWDAFGYAVAVTSGTIVVGAHGAPVEEPSNPGAAYVFTWNESAWVEQQKLTASQPSEGEQFGCSLSISGDTLLVGARGRYGDSPPYAWFYGSAAYVFTRNESTWTQEAKLTASDAAEWDAFGFSVSLSGDTVVVGAWSSDGAGAYSGSAYVFDKPPSGWVDMTETAKLVASDSTAGDEFGWSVGVSGDTVVVGALLDDNAGGTDAGAMYVFVRCGAVWAQVAKVTASDGAAGEEFGDYVALDGNMAVIGAWRDGADVGAAYVFDVPCSCPIPTVSHWGMGVTTLLVLTAATIVLLRRRGVYAYGAPGN